MRFKWNEAKRLANIQKHGIGFVGCEQIFDGMTITIEGYGRACQIRRHRPHHLDTKSNQK